MAGVERKGGVPARCGSLRGELLALRGSVRRLRLLALALDGALWVDPEEPEYEDAWDRVEGRLERARRAGDLAMEEAS